jgi:tyrosine-specific transport protein
MLIGFLMNFIWVAVGIGVLPLTIGEHSIIHAFEHGLPATVPISQILQMPAFTVFAALFALTAICTSFAANGMGLMDFNRDLFVNTLGGSGGKYGRLVISASTFLPPLIIALFFTHVFLKAIGVVGGIGIAVLFGILPAIVFYMKAKTSKGKIVAIVIFLLFLTALGSDLLNDFGVIDTSVEVNEIRLKAQDG